jgi:hypothetical protein
MAKDKKSFVLYCDLIHTFSELSDAKAGKLIKHILAYVNDQNPKTDDTLIKIAFEPIRQQLKRDLQNWEAERSKRSEAGKRGGINSGKSRRSKGVLQFASKNEANEADNVTVTVNVNDTVVEYSNDKFFEFFRRAAGKHISDEELKSEVGKFKNKYPNIHPNQSGALINTWVSNIGKEPAKIKRMVL